MNPVIWMSDLLGKGAADQYICPSDRRQNEIVRKNKERRFILL